MNLHQINEIFNPAHARVFIQRIEQRQVIDLAPEDVEIIEEECAPVVEIHPKVLSKLATHIKENCDDEGIFRGAGIEIEHGDQVVLFDVNCQILYNRDGGIEDAQICWASAEIYGEDGCPIANDFRVSHLKDFLT